MERYPTSKQLPKYKVAGETELTNQLDHNTSRPAEEPCSSEGPVAQAQLPHHNMAMEGRHQLLHIGQYIKEVPFSVAVNLLATTEWDVQCVSYFSPSGGHTWLGVVPRTSESLLG